MKKTLKNKPEGMPTTREGWMKYPKYQLADLALSYWKTIQRMTAENKHFRTQRNEMEMELHALYVPEQAATRLYTIAVGCAGVLDKFCDVPAISITFKDAALLALEDMKQRRRDLTERVRKITTIPKP